MNTRIFKPLTLALFFLLTVFSALGAPTVDSVVSGFSSELLEFNKKRLVIISQGMEFTPEEAASFWVVYADYAKEMKGLQDDGVALIADYFTDISMATTDSTALELNVRSFDIEERRIAIRREFFPRFSEATSEAMAARFMQIDGMVDAAIGLRIAQSLPAFPSELSKLLQKQAPGDLSKF